MCKTIKDWKFKCRLCALISLLSTGSGVWWILLDLSRFLLEIRKLCSSSFSSMCSFFIVVVWTSIVRVVLTSRLWSTYAETIICGRCWQGWKNRKCFEFLFGLDQEARKLICFAWCKLCVLGSKIRKNRGCRHVWKLISVRKKLDAKVMRLIFEDFRVKVFLCLLVILFCVCAP